MTSQDQLQIQKGLTLTNQEQIGPYPRETWIIPAKSRLKVIDFWYVDSERRPIVDAKEFKAGEIYLRPHEFTYND
jgi:hypothetical protein